MILAKLQRFNPVEFSPFYRFSGLGEELDRLFDYTLSAPRVPVDLYEDKETLVVKVELPGFKKDDIALSLKEETLTISGARKEQQNEATFLRRETIAPGEFVRNVTLPFAVDADKIKAAYTDGVLTITLPKAEEAKPKHIPIDVK